MILPIVLLVAIVAGLAWFAKDDVEDYRRFKALKTSRERRRHYTVWIVKQIGYFALPSFIGLALLGRFDTLANMPREFDGLAGLIPDGAQLGGDIIVGMLIGAAVGSTMLSIVLTRRGKKVKNVGDIDHLMPRNRAELVMGGLLSVSAGVTEELLFRLFLPLLIVLVTGSAAIAFAVPVIIFGLMHRYQGTAGVVATGIVGAIFAAIYLATHSLAIVMLAHVVLDLNGLVLRPILSGALRPASD